jgi:hypothetical protein
MSNVKRETLICEAAVWGPVILGCATVLRSMPQLLCQVLLVLLSGAAASFIISNDRRGR